MTIVEAFKDRIIITGPTVESVREEIQTIFAGVGCAYADFTIPVADATGQFVSTGHVRLLTETESA